jgi:hypothetical protein
MSKEAYKEMGTIHVDVKVGPRIFTKLYSEALICHCLIPSNFAYIWMQQLTLYVKTYWHILHRSREQVAKCLSDCNMSEQTFFRVNKLLFDAPFTPLRKPLYFEIIAYI